MRRRRSELEVRIEGDLSFWGRHAGRQLMDTGYSDQNPIALLLSGRSDINPLSPVFGVNLRDIPAEAWRINRAVIQLPIDYRAVLIARYCLPVEDQTGAPIQPAVIANALQLSVRTYFRRLRDAKHRYAQLASLAFS